MGIGDAKRFISTLMTENEFRKEFLKITSEKEYNDFLIKNELSFDDNDFESGITNLLFDCQYESLADQYHQIIFIYQNVTANLK